MAERIGAVVITYNRLEFLKEIIQALRNQTRRPDGIIVINNSSTDGTEEWLKEQNDLTVVTQPNVGSSGGQFTGVKTAYENGYDWIWTMDDDVVPEPDCLELLISDFDKNTVRAPLRYTPDKVPFHNDAITYNLSNPLRSIWNDIAGDSEVRSKYFHAVGITFEGPVMHRSLVEKIGFPEKKFFIYGDDTEYFIRASKAGADIVVICDARLNRKLMFKPQDLFTWKHYYFVRNIIAIDVLHGNSLVRVVRPFGYLIKWLMRCRNSSQVKTTLKAFVDGYFYKSEN